MSYRYDDSGVRIRKSVNGVATDYLVDGTKIIAEKTGNNIIWYYYDAAGTRIGFTYNNTPYYYVYNAQGDVIGLYNSGQQIVARYNYDAWGKIVSITNQQGAEITDTTHIAHINPIRYRGYYYDTETGLYYVSSRYYDPEIGRWINADTTDILTATPMGLTDKNLFAYCDNNPVMRADHGGDFWHIVAGAAIGGLIGGISSIVGQAISGQKINWAEAGVSAASGALTGAITAACPGMGAVATGIVHGVVGAGTHVATELVNGRTPTVVGTLAAGVTSGVLAGGAKAICNRLTTTKLYRSVSTAEAKSFSSTGKFSAGTGQMEGKFFATTRANAKTWGSKLGSGNIISIRVPNSALSHSSVTYFPRLDAIGPAYYFSDLSYLNSVFR